MTEPQDPGAKDREHALAVPESTVDPNMVVMVPIDKISVPKERVTSVWDPEIEKEFEDSVKTKGILEPLRLLDVDGELWLTDGLHRLLKAEQLHISQVPALIKKGTVEDLLIENLIVNRQRGKSNPAQEAEVLAYLVDQRHYPFELAAHQVGLSLDWARKLMKIAHLPEEIKDFLKAGKIPVTGAVYLADLENPQEQISVARDASAYDYTAYQIKARVGQLLNPDREPEEGGYAFAKNGRPQRIPLRCRFCAKELPDVGKQYIWVCSDCEELAASLISDYQKVLKAETAQGGEPNERKA
jgi:ParB/RepB/Spo0J family partition protein